MRSPFTLIALIGTTLAFSITLDCDDHTYVYSTGNVVEPAKLDEVIIVPVQTWEEAYPYLVPIGDSGKLFLDQGP